MERCTGIRDECTKRPHSSSVFDTSKSFNLRIYGDIERKNCNQALQTWVGFEKLDCNLKRVVLNMNISNAYEEVVFGYHRNARKRGQ